MIKKERQLFERVKTLYGIIAVLVLLLLVVIIGDRTTTKYVVTSFTMESHVATESATDNNMLVAIHAENLVTDNTTQEVIDVLAESATDAPTEMISESSTNDDINENNVVLSVPDKVNRGQTVTITMTGGESGTEYYLYVYYSSGKSSAKGLEWTTADKNGDCSWTFRIGNSAKLSIGDNAKFPYLYVGTRNVEKLSSVYYMIIE